MKYKKNIKSLSLLWIGSLFGSGSTFVINMILARQLGKANFGIFSSVLATITIFTLLAGFGIPQVWLKLFGKEGWAGIRWIKPSLKLILYLILTTTLVLFLWAFFGPHSEQTKLLLLIMCFYIYGFVSVMLVSTKFQLEEKYNILAFWQLLPNLSRLVIIVIGFYVLQLSFSLVDIGVIYAVVGLVFALVGVFQLIKMQKGVFSLRGHGEKRKIELQIPKIKDVFMEALPFGFGSLFAFIYVQSDIIMVKYMAGDEQVGLYSASFVILIAIYIFPNVLYQKFLMPKFHRWANQDREKFFNIYKKGNILMLGFGLFFMIFILLFANFFMPLVFGKAYLDSIPLIKILALTLPFIFVAFSMASTLVTQNHMIKKVKYMGSVALINILLNIILIPIYQAKGAAFATVASNMLLLGIYFYANKKHVFSDR